MDLEELRKTLAKSVTVEAKRKHARKVEAIVCCRCDAHGMKGAFRLVDVGKWLCPTCDNEDLCDFDGCTAEADFEDAPDIFTPNPIPGPSKKYCAAHHLEMRNDHCKRW